MVFPSNLTTNLASFGKGNKRITTVAYAVIWYPDNVELLKKLFYFTQLPLLKRRKYKIPSSLYHMISSNKQLQSSKKQQILQYSHSRHKFCIVLIKKIPPTLIYFKNVPVLNKDNRVKGIEQRISTDTNGKIVYCHKNDTQI